MKILIADDDPVSRRLMVEILNPAQTGYKLITAEDGLKAWELLQANTDTKLAILDLAMPGMNGVDWLDRARSDPRFEKLPVIVCTGSRDRATVEMVAARGVRHFLVKPFTRATVLEKVVQVCGPAAPAVVVARDFAGARQRLEIDRDTQRELLRHYIRVAEMWAVDARRAIEFSTVRALAFRAPRLRDVFTDLGAPALAIRFQEMEEMLAPYRTKPLEPAMPLCLRRTRQLAELIQPEIDHFAENLDTLV